MSRLRIVVFALLVVSAGIAQDRKVPVSVSRTGGRTKWYHKVLVVDQKTTGKIAKELLEDMDARWCNYIKSSVGGCPKEKLFPTR
jgi:hypothetical protein